MFAMKNIFTDASIFALMTLFALRFVDSVTCLSITDELSVIASVRKKTVK